MEDKRRLLIYQAIVVGNYLWIHGGEITTWNRKGSVFGSDRGLGDVISSPSTSLDHDK